MKDSKEYQPLTDTISDGDSEELDYIFQVQDKKKSFIRKARVHLVYAFVFLSALAVAIWQYISFVEEISRLRNNLHQALAHVHEERTPYGNKVSSTKV
jgi:hypothetical protein